MLATGRLQPNIPEKPMSPQSDVRDQEQTQVTRNTDFLCQQAHHLGPCRSVFLSCLPYFRLCHLRRGQHSTVESVLCYMRVFNLCRWCIVLYFILFAAFLH